MCITKTQPAKPEDFLLLYIPVSVSAKQSGIRQIYLITSSPVGSAHAECSSRMMASVETQLLLKLPERVTMKEMKRDPILRKWGAIGRNMQGVTFSIDSKVWLALQALIATRNPDAIDFLNDISAGAS